MVMPPEHQLQPVRPPAPVFTDAEGARLEVGDEFTDEGTGRTWEVVDVRSVWPADDDGNPRAEIVFTGWKGEQRMYAAEWISDWQGACFKREG